MLTRAIRRPGSTLNTRSPGPGIIILQSLANECRPSTSRLYITGPVASWSVIRKGKQRADAAIREGTSMSILARHRNLQPPSRALMHHSRHFHASRPRHALPLIPATAAILKVSPYRDTAYIIVDIRPHRHHLRVPNPYLVLPYRYTGRIQIRPSVAMARGR